MRGTGRRPSLPASTLTSLRCPYVSSPEGLTASCVFLTKPAHPPRSSITQKAARLSLRWELLKRKCSPRGGSIFLSVILLGEGGRPFAPEPRGTSPVGSPRQGSGLGFVSPLVSPARKLAPTHPSLFSPFGRETVPAQSSTGILTQHPRLFPRGLRAATGALWNHDENATHPSY